MFLGDYEKFLYKPVERKPVPAPIVRRELVRKAVAPEPEATPKTWNDFPKWKDGRRAWWPALAELYGQNGTRTLAWYGQRVGKDHTSVLYALKTMGLYTARLSPELAERRIAARRGAPSKRSLLRQRVKDRVAEGFSPQATSQKLTPADVLEIRELGRTLSAHQITPRFRVSYSTICRVLSGLTWKYVQ